MAEKNDNYRESRQRAKKQRQTEADDYTAPKIVVVSILKIYKSTKAEWSFVSVISVPLE